jgi:regulator of protease activity HflC (stomatin/prohibitin superfamily)
VLKESERIAILRLGKFLGIKGPGIIWATPILDKIAFRISLREQQTVVDTGKCISSDGFATRITGFVNWRITDVQKAVLAVKNYKGSAETAINHHIKKIGQSPPSDALFVDEERVYSQIRQVLEPLLDKWEIRITEAGLKAAPQLE